jgi:hypothetical protein
MTVYRCFRVADTGQWLDVLFTADNNQFNVPEISHRTDMADALGLTPGELEAVDTDSDQRSGGLLAVPTPPEVPLDPDIVRVQELLGIPRSSWTVAQKAELLELVAREITG